MVKLFDIVILPELSKNVIYGGKLEDLNHCMKTGKFLLMRWIGINVLSTTVVLITLFCVVMAYG